MTDGRLLLEEIDALVNVGHYRPSAWERQFLQSLHGQVFGRGREPSYKQRMIIERIHDDATRVRC